MHDGHAGWSSLIGVHMSRTSHSIPEFLLKDLMVGWHPLYLDHGNCYWGPWLKPVLGPRNVYAKDVDFEKGRGHVQALDCGTLVWDEMAVACCRNFMISDGTDSCAWTCLPRYDSNFMSFKVEWFSAEHDLTFVILCAVYLTFIRI